MQKKIRLKQGVNPIGKTFEMTTYVDGQTHQRRVKYRVFHIHGDTNYTPIEEPLVFAEIATKEHYNSNPFMSLPLSKFAELFQYAPEDQIFWEPVKQYDFVEVADGAEIVGEKE
jgi:hypothetical protein